MISYLSTGRLHPVAALRLLAVALLLVAAPLAAQPVPGRYLVELTTPPLLDARLPLSGAARTARAKEIATEQAFATRQMESLGAEVVHSLDQVGNLMVVHTSEGAEKRLQAIPGVKRVYRVYERRLSLDRLTERHRLPAVWQRLGGIESAGMGQRIGIIDTGIDSRHPGFQDSSLPMPEGYPRFGTPADQADATNKVIVVRNYDRFYDLPDQGSGRDQDGHGTAVAMVAAGARTQAPAGIVSGLAPKAYLGAYRVFPVRAGGANDDAILAAIDDAIRDGMNVINLSLGSTISDVDTDSLYAQAFRRAAEAGVIVVAAAGNEGPDSATIGSPGYLPEVLGVGATWNDRALRVFAQLGSLTVTLLPGSGPAPADPIVAPLTDVLELDPTGLACGPLPSGSLSGRIVIINRGTCLFEEKLNFAAAAGARAAVIVNNVASATIIMSVGEATLPAGMISQADGARLRQRLAEERANGQAGTLDLSFQIRPVAINPQQVASFSSRGPGINQILKPDFSAIGAFVYTAAVTDLRGEVSDPSGWIEINGTSFAAPAVAGAAAILRQARPGLTVDQYRSLLVHTSSEFQTSDGATVQPLAVGAGLLDAQAAAASQLAASKLSLSFRASREDTDQTQEFSIFNLSSEPQTVRLEVVGLGGSFRPELSTTTLEVPAGGSAPVTARLRATPVEPGHSQGVILVTGSQTLRIPYWFGVPSGRLERAELINRPSTLRAGRELDLFIRTFDSTGFPVTGPELRVASSAADLEILETRDVSALSPGVTLVRVRLPARLAAVQLRVELGSESRLISFAVVP